jgi:hypothetical protein
MAIPKIYNPNPGSLSGLPPIVLGVLAGMDKQGETILGTWLYGGSMPSFRRTAVSQGTHSCMARTRTWEIFCWLVLPRCKRPSTLLKATTISNWNSDSCSTTSSTRTAST